MSLLPFLKKYAVRPHFTVYAEDMDKSPVCQHLILPHKHLVIEMQKRGCMTMDKAEAEELLQALHAYKIKKKEQAWLDMEMTALNWSIQQAKRIRTIASHVRSATRKGPAK